MKSIRGLAGLVGLMLLAAPVGATDKEKTSGNPLFRGYYADPEANILGDTYWIFPTFSAPYGKQVSFDCFSSPDLGTWEKHARILGTEEIKWAMWAPSVIEKGGKSCFFFGANDIQNDETVGGIGVAVASKPEVPYKDHLGKPLIDKFGIVSFGQILG